MTTHYPTGRQVSICAPKRDRTAGVRKYYHSPTFRLGTSMHLSCRAGALLQPARLTCLYESLWKAILIVDPRLSRTLLTTTLVQFPVSESYL